MQFVKFVNDLTGNITQYNLKTVAWRPTVQRYLYSPVKPSRSLFCQIWIGRIQQATEQGLGSAPNF